MLISSSPRNKRSLPLLKRPRPLHASIISILIAATTQEANASIGSLSSAVATGVFRRNFLRGPKQSHTRNTHVKSRTLQDEECMTPDVFAGMCKDQLTDEDIVNDGVSSQEEYAAFLRDLKCRFGEGIDETNACVEAKSVEAGEEFFKLPIFLQIYYISKVCKHVDDSDPTDYDCMENMMNSNLDMFKFGFLFNRPNIPAARSATDVIDDLCGGIYELVVSHGYLTECPGTAPLADNSPTPAPSVSPSSAPSRAPMATDGISIAPSPEPTEAILEAIRGPSTLGEDDQFGGPGVFIAIGASLAVLIALLALMLTRNKNQDLDDEDFDDDASGSFPKPGVRDRPMPAGGSDERPGNNEGGHGEGESDSSTVQSTIMLDSSVSDLDTMEDGSRGPFQTDVDGAVPLDDEESVEEDLLAPLPPLIRGASGTLENGFSPPPPTLDEVSAATEPPPEEASVSTPPGNHTTVSDESSPGSGESSPGSSESSPGSSESSSEKVVSEEGSVDQDHFVDAVMSDEDEVSDQPEEEGNTTSHVPDKSEKSAAQAEQGLVLPGEPNIVSDEEASSSAISGSTLGTDKDSMSHVSPVPVNGAISSATDKPVSGSLRENCTDNIVGKQASEDMGGNPFAALVKEESKSSFTNQNVSAHDIVSSDHGGNMTSSSNPFGDKDAPLLTDKNPQSPFQEVPPQTGEQPPQENRDPGTQLFTPEDDTQQGTNTAGNKPSATPASDVLGDERNVIPSALEI